MRSRVLGSYRRLLRAVDLAFKNDEFAKNAARERIRQEYKNTATASDETIENAQNIAQILRTNVVQGVRQSDKNSRPVYKIGLHKESELGDNDSRFDYTLQSSFDAGSLTGAQSKSVNVRKK